MYELPLLSFDYQKLEPYIDTHTVGLHYHKHMANYLNKLNELLNKQNYNFDISMIELATNFDNIIQMDKEHILFNLGGVLNHDVYFNSISDNRNKPTTNLMNDIEKTFGSYENFLQEFRNMALSLTGSGYTFLVINQNNELEIINLPNQETPYYYHYIPLIGLDLWEHAYYINYENKKDLYIDSFLKLMDFKRTNEIYQANNSNNRLVVEETKSWLC